MAQIRYIIMQEEAFEKTHVPRHEFINGGARFNLQACTWKELKAPEPTHNFLKFIGQDYAILCKSIFTIGSSKTLNDMAGLFSFNTVTENVKQWATDSQTSIPAYRVDYGLIEANGRICMFGGKYASTYSNEVTSFCSYSNTWLQMVEDFTGQVPAPRIPLIFSTIGEGILFLFGGRDQNRTYQDAFLVSDGKWVPLNIKNRKEASMIEKLEGMSFCSQRGKVYVFGGKEGDKYNNDMFQIGLEDNAKGIYINQIIETQGPRPSPRANHKLERLGDNCLIVVGGTHEENVYRDMTVYNISKMKWIQIQPLNGPPPALTQLKIMFENHSVFLMGNNSVGQVSRSLIIELTFNEFELVKSQICTACVKRLQMKEKEEQHNPKKPFVSNGLIYNMAVQISFPFQAVSLIMDCARAVEATEININSLQAKNRLAYLDIRFDGKPLRRDQFATIISHSYAEDPVALVLIDKLKLGALRLGKTFIFVSVDGDKRRVFLFSADSLIISHYDEIYEYFAYQERIVDDFVFTQEGIMHKKFIMNQLESYIPKPNDLICSIQSYGLVVFDNNLIMTSEKIYYAEMISTADDMQLCKNSKKVDFLTQVGFELNKDPEVSLSAFLSVAYLENTLKKIVIQDSTTELIDNAYLKTLEKLAQGQKIKELFKGPLKVKRVQADCLLYEVVDEEYLPDAKGILIYYQGRLVNRLDVSFGDLFWQKFYKTKYKKSYKLWDHVGIINFQAGVEPKTSGTSFRQGLFNLFMRHIKKNILYAEPPPKEIMQEEEEAKSSKGQKKQKSS